MGAGKRRPLFKINRRVRKSTSGDTVGLIAMWLFFSVIVIGVLVNASQNVLLGILIVVLIVGLLAVVFSYKTKEYEAEIEGIIKEVSEQDSKVYISELFSRYPKAIQVSYGRICLWVIKKGLPVKYLEVDLESSTTSLIVNKKNGFIPLVKFHAVTILDNETKQSYSVVPYERIGKFMIPDFTGFVANKVVETAKESGYKEISFDDL